MSRILVIEDDPAILRGLADNLKFESHEVLTAADGEAGYRLIREQKPDLIILDLILPKLSGYEVCRKVRDDAGFWQRIEIYLQVNTRATFSHGICPECSKEWSGRPAPPPDEHASH